MGKQITVGDEFDDLVLEEKIKRVINGKNKYFGRFSCKRCGVGEIITRLDAVTSGATRSCGCLAKDTFEQSRQLRYNQVTIFGETKTIREWSEDSRCVVDYETLRGRLKYGKDPEWSLTTKLLHTETNDIKVGDKIHRLEVLEKGLKPHYDQNVMFVKVRCECESKTVFEVPLRRLLDENTRSCGCLKSEIKSRECAERNYIHGQAKDNGTHLYRKWTRMKFNSGIEVCPDWQEFLQFEKWSKENGYQEDYHIYLIDEDGMYKPSNCLWHPMGIAEERLYTTWSDMIRRCENPNFKQYKDYGGRGITICKDWRKRYFTFKEWAWSNSYNDTLTIERKNVNGNYEPNNCTWIPLSMQGKNRR